MKMDIIIVDGEYKGCEASTFTKGGTHYFRDELIESDILLSNHLYIQKDGVLSDVHYLLNLTNAKDIDLTKIKEPLILREKRLENFFNNKEIIEKKFIELLKSGNDEQSIFDSLLSFIQDI